MSKIDKAFLARFNKQAPRYTSYPTAPMWHEMDAALYAQKLTHLSPTAPLSLYFHIPFCKTMCLYCACSVILNRKEENEIRYVEYLCKEIDVVCSHWTHRRKASQIHFGGGTPTKLSIPLLTCLFEKIDRAFDVNYDEEISIEIDPRTVFDDRGEKLNFLRDWGINRVSFGVQDTNAQVQEAIKRKQTLEMTLWTYNKARSLGFKGINIDLIYGLPFQTATSFRETVQHILEMRPDRISLFSYAKVPWLKPHQKAIDDHTLPSTDEKFEIYANAREAFVQAGYVAIGMDHFGLEEDSISQGYRTKQLQRNFQGYSLKLAEDLIGFGASSIGYVQGLYTQSYKELPQYYSALDQKQLPIFRGKELTEADHLHKWVIHTLMCDFEIDKSLFRDRFGDLFDDYFKDVATALKQLEEEGLIINSDTTLSVTPLGELFIRIVAMTFDPYLRSSSQKEQFSQSV